MAEPRTIPLLPGQTGGIIAILAFAILSSIMILYVAISTAYLAIQHYRGAGTNRSEYTFFQTQLGRYVACLLVFDFINSLSGWISIHWVAEKAIAYGSLCRAQATLMQVGNLGQAYFTVSIAIHTFNSLVLRRRPSNLVCFTTVAAGWILSVFLAVIPYMTKIPGEHVYGLESELSCSIESLFPKAEFGLQLLPVLLSSVISAILYSIIFLVLRGILRIQGGIKLSLDPRTHWEDSNDMNYYRFVAKIARSVLWFPAAYTIVLVPYSVIRAMRISGYTISFHGIVLEYICQYALGIFNVCLLYNTFRVLGPALTFPRDTSAAKDMESFASPNLLPQAISIVVQSTDSHISSGLSNSFHSPIESSRSLSVYSSASADEPLLHTSSNLGRRIVSGIVAEKTSYNKTPLPTPKAGDHTSFYLSTDNIWSLPAPPRPARSPILEQPNRPWEPLRRKRSTDEDNLPFKSHRRDQSSDIIDVNGRPLASAFSPSFTIAKESLPLPQLPEPSAGRRSISLNVTKPTSSSNEMSRAHVDGNRKGRTLQQGVGRATTYSYVVEQNRTVS